MVSTSLILITDSPRYGTLACDGAVGVAMPHTNRSAGGWQRRLHADDEVRWRLAALGYW